MQVDPRPTSLVVGYGWLQDINVIPRLSTAEMASGLSPDSNLIEDFWAIIKRTMCEIESQFTSKDERQSSKKNFWIHEW